jgi:hypothetical protein
MRVWVLNWLNSFLPIRIVLNALTEAKATRQERKRIISARLANKAEPSAERVILSEGSPPGRRSYHGNYQIDSEGWSKAN